MKYICCSDGHYTIALLDGGRTRSQAHAVGPRQRAATSAPRSIQSAFTMNNALHPHETAWMQTPRPMGVAYVKARILTTLPPYSLSPHSVAARSSTKPTSRTPQSGARTRPAHADSNPTSISVMRAAPSTWILGSGAAKVMHNLDDSESRTHSFSLRRRRRQDAEQNGVQ